jgi:hypothetical protein
VGIQITRWRGCALACAGSQGEGRRTDQLLAVGILFECECVTGLKEKESESRSLAKSESSAHRTA